jgi:hypothetical protein
MDIHRGIKAITAAAAVALLILFGLNAAPARGQEVIEKWNQLHSELEKALELINEQRKVPDSSWIPFKTDKASIEKDIEALLDEAISVLNVSDLSRIKGQIREAQTQIRKFQKRISRLQTQKLMAPEEVSDWKVWKKDVADYETQIADYRKAIADNEARIDALKAEFIEKVATTGVKLDPDQIDTLIYSITGDDDVEMISVFNNVKLLTTKLKELTRDSRENIETARRYYGMHVVLLKTLLYLQNTYIARIDSDYLPALRAIEADNAELMENTEALLADSEPRHRGQYEANLAAQALTDKTVKLYMRYLAANRERVTASRSQIEKEYKIAENTYHTVSTAYALIEVMRNADQFFDSLSALQVPDLLTFDNREMKEEFKKLTSKMAEE